MLVSPRQSREYGLHKRERVNDRENVYTLCGIVEHAMKRSIN